MGKEKVTVNLAEYDNSWYNPGAGIIKRVIWYCLSALIFDSYLLPISRIKCIILRLFGASVGTNVIIKPLVRIKYPWYLRVGDNVWIGESVWIDNLAQVDIGRNVCISQNVYLLTGNHDYKDIRFNLIIGDIKVEDGAWLGASSVICPGVTVSFNSVVTAGSILQQNTRQNCIYGGNPAEYIQARELSK